jgi:hypothetical protein
METQTTQSELALGCTPSITWPIFGHSPPDETKVPRPTAMGSLVGSGRSVYLEASQYLLTLPRLQQAASETRLSEFNWTWGKIYDSEISD